MKSKEYFKGVMDTLDWLRSTGFFKFYPDKKAKADKLLSEVQKCIEEL